VTDIRSGAFSQRPSIVLTTKDFNRLSSLLDTVAAKESSATLFLREELDRAIIVSGEVAATSLVIMTSEVKFIDHDSVSSRLVRLVYPDEIKDSRAISVLTSIGSALLGLGPGQSISWSENGKERRITVIEVRSTQEQ
jgi:regulator of nucleoside diphosphate kinase